MTPSERDPIQQEMHDWLHSNDPAQVAHAHAVQALSDPNQSLDEFRARCTLVPMHEQFGQWELKQPNDYAKVRDHLINPAETTQAERTQQFNGLLEHIDETFRTRSQPLLPVMSLHAAKWILFYKASSFTEGGAMAHPNQVNGMGLYQAGSVAEMLSAVNHMASKGDPVEFYFNHLKRELRQR